MVTLHSSWLGDNFGEHVCVDDVLSIPLSASLPVFLDYLGPLYCTESL